MEYDHLRGAGGSEPEHGGALGGLEERGHRAGGFSGDFGGSGLSTREMIAFIWGQVGFDACFAQCSIHFELVAKRIQSKVFLDESESWPS